MSYLIPLSDGEVVETTEATPKFDIEAALKAQAADLDRIKKVAEEDLYWRKIATYAGVAGAIVAAIRLTDIWIALRRRREST